MNQQSTKHDDGELINRILSQFKEQVAFMLMFTIKEMHRVQQSKNLTGTELLEKAFSEGIRMGKANPHMDCTIEKAFQSYLASVKKEIDTEQDTDYKELAEQLYKAFMQSGIPLSKKQVVQIVEAIRYPMDRAELDGAAVHVRPIAKT